MNVLLWLVGAGIVIAIGTVVVLFYLKDTGSNNTTITEESASYDSDGYLECPRCGIADHLQVTGLSTRRAECPNCAFQGLVEDGVQVHIDVENDSQGRDEWCTISGAEYIPTEEGGSGR